MYESKTDKILAENARLKKENARLKTEIKKLKAQSEVVKEKAANQGASDTLNAQVLGSAIGSFL